MARQVARRPRGRHAAHEVRPRDVIAGVEAVEVAAHARELVVAVALQRALGFVARTPCGLGSQAGRQAGVARQHRGALPGVVHEVTAPIAEDGIDQAPRAGLRRRHRQPAAHHGVHRRAAAQAPRQQVGPVLAAMQIAHVLVVRVEHHAGPRPDLVGRQRHEHTAGARVALHRGNDELAAGLDQAARDVVDGVDVAPALVGRAVGGFDEVEVDAIAPEVGAAGEQQHRLRQRQCRADGRLQTLALRRAHGAVVKREVQRDDAAADLEPDFVAGGSPGPQRQRGSLGREGLGGRQLETARRLAAAHAADPDRTVDRGAQQGVVAARHHLARRAVHWQRLGVAIEQVARHAKQRVQHAGAAVGGAQLAQHGGGVVARPVDGAVALAHQGLPAAARVGLRRGRRRGAVRLEVRHGAQHGARRGRGHLLAVEAGLGGRGHRKSLGGPHRAGVHLGHGLQHGRAPGGLAVQDRPVQRRRPAVARDARVHDQAGQRAPHRLRNGALEKRGDQQIRLEQGHRFLGDAVGNVELHRHRVPKRRELQVQPLRQAVEAAREKQDSHRPPACVSRSSAAGRPSTSRRCAGHRSASASAQSGAGR